MKRAKLISYNLGERPHHEELWELRFAELVEFQKKYGHTRVPARWRGNRSLGRWLAHQRDLLRLEELRRDRAERLDQLGAEWSQVPEYYDGKERYFESMLTRLAAYREKFGDAEVSRTHDRELAEWVGNQRGSRKTGAMSKKRLARLEEVDFPWGKDFRTWEEQLIQLRVYKARFGNTKVPKRWSEDAVLGRWVAHQRELFRAGKLPDQKRAVLDLLGFQWVLRTPKVWKEKRREKRKVERVPKSVHIEALKQYRERFGDTQVPARWKENKALGRWVAHQRELFRQGRMPEERKRMLDDLGFQWEVTKDG